MTPVSVALGVWIGAGVGLWVLVAIFALALCRAAGAAMDWDELKPCERGERRVA